MRSHEGKDHPSSSKLPYLEPHPLIDSYYHHELRFNILDDRNSDLDDLDP